MSPSNKNVCKCLCCLSNQRLWVSVSHMVAANGTDPTAGNLLTHTGISSLLPYYCQGCLPERRLLHVCLENTWAETNKNKNKNTNTQNRSTCQEKRKKRKGSERPSAREEGELRLKKFLIRKSGGGLMWKAKQLLYIKCALITINSQMAKGRHCTMHTYTNWTLTH